MAGASYISNRDPINQFPAPQGWLAIRHDNPQDGIGFEAIFFVNGTTLANSTEIVISYAGTDGDGGSVFANPDKQADAVLGLGLWSDQLGQAAAYYLEIKALNPYATISFTGHSLGGGLASLMSVFFGETAFTFDQAPFRAALVQAQNLKNYLLIHEAGTIDATTLNNLLAPLDRYITAADPDNLDPIVVDTLGVRQTLVTDINVQGEFLSTGAWTLLNRIGTPSNTGDIPNSASGVTGEDLHSQSLLTAFLQSGDTSTSTESDHTLGQATFKLPDLLKMIFDKKLFAFSTGVENKDNENLLERLVKHEAGVQGSITAADQMLTRFTSDLWKLAQDGGLTMTDGIPGGLFSSAPNNVSKTLMAFAMQKYYEETDASPGYSQELFTDLTTAGTGSNGIQFDMADVSDKFAAAIQNNEKLNLKDAKGFDLYFKNYLQQSIFTTTEQQLIQSLLPYLRDWYVQVGADIIFGGKDNDNCWRIAA
jgi:hypothetical protein